MSVIASFRSFPYGTIINVISRIVDGVMPNPQSIIENKYDKSVLTFRKAKTGE